jgi:hypothetical protein
LLAVKLRARQQVMAARVVVVGVNRRLGRLRALAVPNGHVFAGPARIGTGNDVSRAECESQAVLIIGGGAFSSENARTALEAGAE